jgi:hypothetical protein
VCENNLVLMSVEHACHEWSHISFVACTVCINQRIVEILLGGEWS